jgi:hypothetical protein
MSAPGEPAAPEGLREAQRALARHLRDPERHPPPAGMAAQGAAVYRRLVANNLAGFVENGFPVLHALMTPEGWDDLTAGFLGGHRFTTPYFLDIGREFLDYLLGERPPRPSDPPFMLELAHYEWVELALAVADPEPPVAVDGDLLAGSPLLSPLAWPLAYRYPVHRIGPDFLPYAPDAEPTYLVVYRDGEYDVHFLAVSPPTARLLELLDSGDRRSGEALLRQVAGELGHPDPAQVVARGGEALADLRERGVILGVRPDHEESEP